MSENYDHNYVESSERLNAYIEALLAETTTVNAGPHNEADARLWQTARLLKIAAHPEKAAVRPEFAADLEKRLLVQQRLLTPSEPAKSWWPDWLTIPPISWSGRWAVAAVATLLLLAFLVVPLIEQWQRPLPSLPALVQVVQAYWGMEGLPPQPAQLGNVYFELATSLPAVPESLTVYQQEANPVSLADVEAIARRLSIDSRVYPVGESFVVDDGQQRLVMSRMQKGYYHYHQLPPPVSFDQAPIQADRAAEQAHAFLQGYGLLDFTPASPQVTVLPMDKNDGRYQVFFPQTVDRLVVENAGVTVLLNEFGQILEVTGRTILPAAIGRYPLLSAAAAFDALQNRDASRVFLVDSRQDQVGVATHTVVVVKEESEKRAPPVVYQPGTSVEVEGLLRATIFADSDGNPGRVHAFLVEDTNGYAFRLLGPRLVDLAQHDQFHVHIWGTIVLDNQGQVALLIEDYRRSRPQEAFVTLLGQLVVIETDGQEQLLLLADDGRLYAPPWSKEPEAIARYRPLVHSGQQVLLSGTLADDYASGDYPRLITAVFEFGSEIAELQSAVERPVQRPQVVEDELLTLSGQAMITEITLTYFTLALPTGATANTLPGHEEARYIIPVYRFEGQTDNGTLFTIYVQASR
jgi:hypothetical protein